MRCTCNLKPAQETGESEERENQQKESKLQNRDRKKTIVNGMSMVLRLDGRDNSVQ